MRSVLLLLALLLLALAPNTSQACGSAVSAATVFVPALGLPVPLVVESGYGHAAPAVQLLVAPVVSPAVIVSTPVVTKRVEVRPLRVFSRRRVFGR